MTALREVLAHFGVDWDKTSLQQGTKAVDGAITKLRQFAGVIGGAAVVMGLRNMVTELQVQGDSLGKTSAQLGTTTDSLQAYRHAANLASVGNEQFDQSLRTLQKNQDAAAQGGAEQSKTFKRLGIDVQNARGKLKTLDEILPELADGLKNIEDPAERGSIAAKLLGDAGARLLPMFSQGAAGLAAARLEIEKLGGGITADAVADLEAFGDAQTRLTMGMTSLKVQLGKGLIPMLASFAERTAYMMGRLSRFAAAVREVVAESNIMTGVLTVAGGAGVSKLIALAGGWKGIGRLIMQATRVLGIFLLRLALPALLIDELITTWQGGDTIITRILDGWFGEGTTSKVVGFFKLFTSGWETLGATVDDIALMVGAILVGMLAEVTGAGASAFASIADAAGAAWNKVLEITANAIGKIAKMLDSVGLSSIAQMIGGAGASLAGMRAEGGNADVVTQARHQERTERVDTFEAAKARIGGRINNVQAPTTINVTVPPGTPATIAERTARATSGAIQQSNQAKYNALVPQVR